MRYHMNYEEAEASRILDLVRAGFDVPADLVNWCLWVLGDLVGVA